MANPFLIQSPKSLPYYLYKMQNYRKSDTSSILLKNNISYKKET